MLEAGRIMESVTSSGSIPGGMKRKRGSTERGSEEGLLLVLEAAAGVEWLRRKERRERVVVVDLGMEREEEEEENEEREGMRKVSATAPLRSTTVIVSYLLPEMD